MATSKKNGSPKATAKKAGGTKRRHANPKAANSKTTVTKGAAGASFSTTRGGGGSDAGSNGVALTDAKIVMVDVPGSANVTEEFKDRVMQIADSLGTNPNYLMAVMSFESGATFSPSIKNAAGSGAVGLIQFMPATARGLGTTTDKLALMTAEQQLDFVAKYFAPFRGRLKTIEDTYMAVLFPAAIGRGSDHVLFKRGTRVYDQNRGLDHDRDGLITVGEAADKVRARLGAAATGTGEILRRGVRGAEVEKLQNELVDLGYLRRAQMESGLGTFGPMTEDALKNFQGDNTLTENGTYDAATQAALRQLNEGIKRDSQGAVVRGLQSRLVALGYMTLAETTSGHGIFGPRTEAALKAFQLQHGISQNGVLTDETYQALLAAIPPTPVIGASNDSTRVDTLLPTEGRGFTTYRREPGGADQYGRARTIRCIQSLAEAWATHHATPRLAVGDISRRHGGAFPPHASHQKGIDVDFRPLTNNGIEEQTNVGAANYSHALTRELVLLVKEMFPTAMVLFNDTRLISAGLTKHAAGHDNHLHVRFN
ncbi:MAG: penicillin-insensitive murein endopeptidase [Pyrinomonadaceae bacterium MAG19_C2-C3]|nr:penicillin-insensitive murein endopeptidase [Pyrinomonadaceae bacterium MAG19_C2-C3]